MNLFHVSITIVEVRVCRKHSAYVPLHNRLNNINYDWATFISGSYQKYFNITESSL